MLSVVYVEEVCLPVSVTVTVAPGTTAPALSLTVPTIVPVVTWALTGTAHTFAAAASKTAATRCLVVITLLSC